MGVDVGMTPDVVDCTSIVPIVPEDIRVNVVATPVVIDDTSVVIELAIAEGMGVDVIATPVVVDVTLVVLVVSKDVGADVLFPSSQASIPTFRPSPQIAVQLVCSQVVLVQSHPASLVQVLLQPSPSAVLPSSQASSPASFASPQAVALHVSGEVNEPPLQL